MPESSKPTLDPVLANPTEADAQLLASKLGQLLMASNARISCAESCTGGGIAYAITSVSGSSAWFDKSWVTYANDAKIDMLGVAENTLVEFGAVSHQTATEMLQGVVENSGANVAVSVTGIAGPSGGSEDKPVGLVWFGFAINQQQWVVSQQFFGDRQTVRRKAVTFALQFLIEQLVEAVA